MDFNLYNTFITKYGQITLYKNEVAIGREFINGNYWDEDTLIKLKEYIDPNKNILEIGGHCGTSSIVYASYLNEGRQLYVFEPQKNMFNLLLYNIKQNNLENKIIPYNFGMFCCFRKATMNDIDLDGGGGIVSKRYTEEINLPCNFGGICLGKNGEEVSLVAMDDMNLQNIGYIHCDAQGSENFIFYGGKETIKKYRPVILYENKDLCGTYLHNNVCNSYPEFINESQFDIKKYCMETLNYSQYIDGFNNSHDTLLIP